MATFFPKLLEGSTTEVGRVGNCHAMAAPWDAYKAQDGWVLICSASNAQWRTVCDIIRRSELAEDPRYLTVADRVNRRPEVDFIVQEWVGKTTIEGVVETLGRAGIPCGPVTKMNQFPREANLEHRGMVKSIRAGSKAESIYVSSSPLKMTRTPGISPDRIPEIDENRAEVHQLMKSRPARERAAVLSPQAARMPLQGIRVIEIGHYTTAPLSARHLANLGADVIKVEPPDGEAVRGWPPAKKGIGYFFAYTNASKRSLALKLENEDDCKILETLLRESDVLIENLKPGALSKRGFSPDRIADLNPRLIYCAVSGFGADSLYAGRPAYDSVIQAMSGFMDITRAESSPIKSGISFADIMGAEMATVAILAALEARDRLNCGQYIDLSMQDVAAWTTQSFWNRGQQQVSYQVLRANDGYVVTDVQNQKASDFKHHTSSEMSKDELAKKLQNAGYIASPVLTASEVLKAPQTHSRNLLSYANDQDGDSWPLLGSPLRLSGTPPVLGKPMTVLDADRDSILSEMGVFGGARPQGRISS
jgi:crotonobetainyl-CoA:carnitine CoA-transferase CaiB-like acyl-CoA transferase